MDLIGVVGLAIGLIFLGYASPRWGVDSRDTIDSPEWLRRETWPPPVKGWG